MVTMATKQKIFGPLYFFETVRGEPIPHKNFTPLGQGNLKIPGVSADPALVVSDVSTNTLGNRSVKYCYERVFSCVKRGCREFLPRL